MDNIVMKTVDIKSRMSFEPHRFMDRLKETLDLQNKKASEIAGNEMESPKGTTPDYRVETHQKLPNTIIVKGSYLFVGEPRR